MSREKGKMEEHAANLKKIHSLMEEFKHHAEVIEYINVRIGRVPLTL